MENKQHDMVSALTNIDIIARNRIGEQLKEFQQMIVDKEYAFNNYDEFKFHTLNDLCKIVNYKDVSRVINDIIFDNAISYIEDITGLKLERKSYCYPKYYIYNNNYKIYLDNKRVVLNFEENINLYKSNMERIKNELNDIKIPNSIWDIGNKNLSNIIYVLFHKKRTNNVLNNIIKSKKDSIKHRKTVLKNCAEELQKLKKERDIIIPKLKLLENQGYTVKEI